MIISFSEVYKLQTCKRQYWYQFILNLRPEEESEAITTGTKGHKLLQNFYNFMQTGHSKEEAIKLTAALAGKEIAKTPFTESKALLSAWTLVDNYIRATEFTSEAIYVENRFLVPLSKFTKDPALAHIQIGFTPDVVFKRAGDFLDIEDAKFVQRAWSKKKVRRFPQAKLYQIFMESMGHKVSRTTLRFFNVKTGVLDFQNYTLKDKERQNLLDDFIDGVEDVIRFRQRSTPENGYGPRTMNYGTCQYCAFEFVCSLEAEGKDASRTIDTQFIKGDYNYAN